MTTITTLPTPPSRANPTTFAVDGDAFLGALPQFVTETNALGVDVTNKSVSATNSASSASTSATIATNAANAAANSNNSNATSTTSLTVGTGSKTLTTQTGKAFVVGMSVKIADTVTPTNGMYGDVTAYNTSTGSLTVDVAYITGSGTVAAWTISIAVPGSTMSSFNTSIATLNSFVGDTGAISHRNKIINGAMQIDQANAGAVVNNVVGASYGPDMFGYRGSVAGKFSGQQVATSGLSGYPYCLKVLSLSAYAVAAGDHFSTYTVIEGYNFSDAGWGAAGALPVTLSFNVFSSLTGTFGAALTNNGASRSYPFTYTITVANTWTRVTVTVPGDTIGTWLTNNGVGAVVYWGLGVGATYSGAAGAWAAGAYYSATGSVSLVSTNGAQWSVTSVQVELGTVATPFVKRSYAQELADCQRYYQTYDDLFVGGNTSAGGTVYTDLTYRTALRAVPTVTIGTVTYSNASTYSTNSITASRCRLSITITGGGYGYGYNGGIELDARM